MSLIVSDGTLRGSFSRTTKSANFPGAIEPLIFSSTFRSIQSPYFECFVHTDSLVFSLFSPLTTPDESLSRHHALNSEQRLTLALITTVFAAQAAFDKEGLQ